MYESDMMHKRYYSLEDHTLAVTPYDNCNDNIRRKLRSFETPTLKLRLAATT